MHNLPVGCMERSVAPQQWSDVALNTSLPFVLLYSADQSYTNSATIDKDYFGYASVLGLYLSRPLGGVEFLDFATSHIPDVPYHREITKRCRVLLYCTDLFCSVLYRKTPRIGKLQRGLIAMQVISQLVASSICATCGLFSPNERFLSNESVVD